MLINKTSYFGFVCLLVGACTLSLSGCSGSSKPVMGAVHGKVTLDGQPFAEGRVEMKDQTTGAAGAAELQSDGTFKIVTPDGGIRVGTYNVVVLPPPVAAVDPVEAAKGIMPAADTSKIPGIYREFATSGFKVTVVKGDNQVDLPMKSK